MLDTFMQKLAEEMEIEGSFATGVPGVYQIPIDEGLTVTLSDIPHGFQLSCTVSDCPKVNEETFYTQAMLANLFAQGTEGCILGLDSTGSKVTLSQEIDYEVNWKEFCDMMEDFFNACEFWRDEVNSYAT